MLFVLYFLDTKSNNCDFSNKCDLFQNFPKRISVTTQIRANPVTKIPKKNKCDLTLIREVRVEIELS